MRLAVKEVFPIVLTLVEQLWDMSFCNQLSAAQDGLFLLLAVHCRCGTSRRTHYSLSTDDYFIVGFAWFGSCYSRVLLVCFQVACWGKHLLCLESLLLEHWVHEDMRVVNWHAKALRQGALVSMCTLQCGAMMAWLAFLLIASWTYTSHCGVKLLSFASFVDTFHLNAAVRRQFGHISKLFLLLFGVELVIET